MQTDGSDAPLSEHTNETEAERAALAEARARQGVRVLVHDRYTRVHVAGERR